MSAVSAPVQPIIVAIDGFSACGKSTLAKALAKRLNYLFIDTGAMYRAVTWYFIQHHIPMTVDEEVALAMSRITIHFERIQGENQTFLNGENVEQAIRSPAVSDLVSPVSARPLVRTTITAQQRLMGKHKGIVMEGRDIGTAVFPHAELKIFLTADFDTRVRRRLLELQSKGLQLSHDEVAANLEQRDYLDSHRAMNPLRQAEDAVVLDNTSMTVDEQIAWILNLPQIKFSTTV